MAVPELSLNISVWVVLVPAEAVAHMAALMELLRQCYHTRADEARDCFRAEECRIYCKKNNLTVSPENTVARRAGDITLDNVNYQRYMGEMQILKCDLPADERVNVIASLNEEEQKLLKYLTSSTAFQFV